MRRLLLDKWAALLADAAVAASGAEVAAAHSPLLFLAASPSALLIVAPHLRRALPAVLDALTLTLQQNPGEIICRGIGKAERIVLARRPEASLECCC